MGEIKKGKQGGPREFVFFSDNCSGQNKNKAIAGMYRHAILSQDIDQITHYYLEAGHTQNEGDSMHSVIEKASRRVNIYSPMQWYTLASSAKKSGSSYSVNEMEGFMLDFKKLGEEYCKNLREAFSLKTLQWQKVRALRVKKSSPHVLFVKYAFAEDDFIPFVDRSYSQETLSHLVTVELLPIDNESTVSKAKKDDLLYMCRELIIPKDYHQFYEALVIEKSNDNNDKENAVESDAPKSHSQQSTTRKRKRDAQVEETSTKKLLRTIPKKANTSTGKKRSVSC